MKYYLPALSLAVFALGFYLGGKDTAQEFGGVVEHSLVREAALEVPLHTVVLTRLREGDTDKAIEILEHSLGTSELLLDHCTAPSCRATSSRMIKRARRQLEEYRERFHGAGAES